MGETIKKYTSLSEAVSDLFGSSVSISDRRSVHGGDINDAYAVTLSDGRSIFIKQNSIKNADFFRAEIIGINAIKSTGAVSVPTLLAWGTDDTKGISFLMMEYIKSGPRKSDYYEVLGRNLADMHRYPIGDKFGFDEDNYIGAGYQENGWSDSFVEFFRDHRLAPQIERASGYMDNGLRSSCDKLLSKIDEILIEPDAPSLLHGDLWGGNIYPGPDGHAMLIDPAVYIGHREADLAMTELFGGFSSEFYSAYNDAYPLQPGYGERRDLYNLYHMLNHLNLFGSGYLSSVKRIVYHYV